MPSVLITGIAGQTGSYLAEEFVAAGWNVHGLVRTEDHLDARLPATEHVADLLDDDALRAVIGIVRPDALVNLAALSSVAASWQQPALTARVNGASVGVLLAALADNAAADDTSPAFVQASSAEIFGAAATAPQNESTPLDPVNPYGQSKAIAHLFVQTYREAGLRASNAVLYNHESPRRPEAFVTRKITASVARIEAGLQQELRLGNLDAERDWGWAPDYAHALYLLATGSRPGDYVIATGVAHSIRDFVIAAFAHVGITDWQRHVVIDEQFVRPADAPELRGDAMKLRETYGWQPTLRFEDIVAAMVDADRAALADGEQAGVR